MQTPQVSAADSQRPQRSRPRARADSRLDEIGHLVKGFEAKHRGDAGLQRVALAVFEDGLLVPRHRRLCGLHRGGRSAGQRIDSARQSMQRQRGAGASNTRNQCSQPVLRCRWRTRMHWHTDALPALVALAHWHVVPRAPRRSRRGGTTATSPQRASLDPAAPVTNSILPGANCRRRVGGRRESGRRARGGRCGPGETGSKADCAVARCSSWCPPEGW